MTKFEEEFNYLIELSGKILIGQVDAEAFEKNRIAFFEKYETVQQQALPVVPECVAKDIEKLKSFNKDGKNFHVFDLSYYSEESVNWVEYDYDNYVKFYLAIATGKYEVEKPQLFYLENKLTGMYLYKKALRGYGEEPSSSIKYLTDDFKFTQQEINSMQTGSYEQIEVAE